MGLAGYGREEHMLYLVGGGIFVQASPAGKHTYQATRKRGFVVEFMSTEAQFSVKDYPFFNRELTTAGAPSG
jgi:hypothetical protein